MKKKKTSRVVKKQMIRSLRQLLRYCRKHFAVLMPISVLMVLMVCTYFGFQKGTYFSHLENIEVKAATQEEDETNELKEKADHQIGLTGMMNGIECIRQYARSARMIRTTSPNEQILVGAEGISRSEHRRKNLEKSMTGASVWFEKAKELVRNNQMDYSEYETLLRIVEAEATGEDFEGKRLIANVILNRVSDQRFPDTIEDVVWQQEDGCAQFQPTVDGRIDDVEITEDTILAVDEALQGVDHSRGALFFMARSASDDYNVDWFDSNLQRLFVHGGHEYFTLTA